MRPYEANKIRAIVDALERGMMSRLVAAEKLREIICVKPKLPLVPIVRLVAAWGMVPVEVLVGPSRKRPISEVRHVAMFMCRKYGNVTNSEIAKFFNRDQTSVSRAILKILDDSKYMRTTEFLSVDLKIRDHLTEVIS